MNKKIYIIKSKERVRPKKSEVTRLCSNSKKAKKLIKWVPKFSGKEGLNMGLRKTIEWYLTDLDYQSSSKNKYIV